MTDRETTENSSSSRFSEIWRRLSHNQRRFVVAMQSQPTKADAARAVELTPDTVYRWPAMIDEAVALLSEDVKGSAVEMLATALAEAVMVKLGGLKSGDERIRQDAATEIMDRVIGKAQAYLDVTTRGESLEVALNKLATQVIEMSESELVNFAGTLPDFETGGAPAAQAEEPG